MRWQPLAAGLTCHSQSTEQPGIFLRHMAQMCQEWPQRVTKLCCNTDSILQCHQMTSTSSRNFQLFRIFAFQGTEAGLVSRRVRKNTCWMLTMSACPERIQSGGGRSQSPKMSRAWWQIWIDLGHFTSFQRLTCQIKCYPSRHARSFHA